MLYHIMQYYVMLYHIELYYVLLYCQYLVRPPSEVQQEFLISPTPVIVGPSTEEEMDIRFLLAGFFVIVLKSCLGIHAVLGGDP